MEGLLGEVLRTGKGRELSTAEALSGLSFIGLYFSAHWSPPCRLFDRTLSSFFNAEVNKSRK